MNKVMFAGPSGFGKTTLANWVSEEYKIHFINGSVSELIPKTKDIPHEEMLSRDKKTLALEDYQVMNLRNKLFKDKDDFVSDRSYLDLAAYFYYKQSSDIPGCEIEHFLEMNRMLLCKQCSHLIFFHFTPEMIHEWVIEDNQKRIMSNYFQLQISEIMYLVLKLWGYKRIDNFLTKMVGAERGVIKTVYGTTEVLIITDANLLARKILISKFLG